MGVRTDGVPALDTRFGGGAGREGGLEMWAAGGLDWTGEPEAGPEDVRAAGGVDPGGIGVPIATGEAIPAV